jgi:ElaB/YqjD/DUF883 family membrane-anchored ribosome-binding protein
MMSWGRAEDRASRYLKELDVHSVNDQLDNVRAYLKDLTDSFGKIANRQWGHAGHRARDAAEEAEELMKNNLAASLIIALGVGVLVGYMIRRGTE